MYCHERQLERPPIWRAHPLSFWQGIPWLLKYCCLMSLSSITIRVMNSLIIFILWPYELVIHHHVYTIIHWICWYYSFISSSAIIIQARNSLNQDSPPHPTQNRQQKIRNKLVSPRKWMRKLALLGWGVAGAGALATPCPGHGPSTHGCQDMIRICSP